MQKIKSGEFGRVRVVQGLKPYYYGAETKFLNFENL